MSSADAVVLAARGVVAGVLAVSAVAKLRDVRATRASLVAIGLPGGLDRSLPVVEGFTSLGLLIERRTAWAALVACALLAGFGVFVTVLIARGVREPCPCFGSTGRASSVGLKTVARNLVLLAVAVVGTARATDFHWVVWVACAATTLVVARVSTHARRRTDDRV